MKKTSRKVRVVCHAANQQCYAGPTLIRRYFAGGALIGCDSCHPQSSALPDLEECRGVDGYRYKYYLQVTRQGASRQTVIVFN